MPFNQFWKQENKQEALEVDSFGELLKQIKNLESKKRPPAQVFFEEIYRITRDQMPYDKTEVTDFEQTELGKMGFDGKTTTRKIALTHYLKLNNKDKARAVCRHQALLAALLVEKVVEYGLLPTTTRSVRGSGTAFYADKYHGHAWADITFFDDKDNKKKVYIIDAAQETYGELTTDKKGASFVGRSECNTGVSTEWDPYKTWPYQTFGRSGALNADGYNYTLMAKSDAPDFIKNESRHLITRDSKVDKGYKWDAAGEPAVVVDWDKQYSTGFDRIEKELVAAIYKRVKSQDYATKNNYEETKKEQIERRVSEVVTFEELFETIRELREVHGASGIHYAEDIIKKIQSVRYENLSTEHITRAFGLREKVESLLSAS